MYSCYKIIPSQDGALTGWWVRPIAIHSLRARRATFFVTRVARSWSDIKRTLATWAFLHRLGPASVFYKWPSVRRQQIVTGW